MWTHCRASVLNSFHSVASGCGQSLTLSASSLVTVQGSSGYCRRLFYTAILGEHQQCRTLCVERKTNASWKFTVSANFHWVHSQPCCKLVWLYYIGEAVQKIVSKVLHVEWVGIVKSCTYLSWILCCFYLWYTPTACVRCWSMQTDQIPMQTYTSSHEWQ